MKFPSIRSTSLVLYKYSSYLLQISCQVLPSDVPVRGPEVIFASGREKFPNKYALAVNWKLKIIPKQVSPLITT